MSQFSNDNDDILYSKDYGPIISEDERNVLENKLIKKIADIPKPLLDELKTLKNQCIQNNYFNFNESMIIRVGTRIVIDGMNDLVISLINDEDILIKSLWSQFNLEQRVQSNDSGSLYSRNVSSIVYSGKKDYSTFAIRKTVYMPFKMFADIKKAKSLVEKETGDYWIKDNTFIKIGLMLMLDVLKSMDIRNYKTEDELLDAVRKQLRIE